MSTEPLDDSLDAELLARHLWRETHGVKPECDVVDEPVDDEEDDEPTVDSFAELNATWNGRHYG